MPRVKTIADKVVLDRALTLLVEVGFHRFTLPQVGQAVGLSPSTLIQRFGSKRGLLDRVLARATERLKAETQSLPNTGNPRLDLIGWLVNAAQAFRTRELVAGNLLLLIEDLNDEYRRSLAILHIETLRGGVQEYLVRLGSSSLELHVEMLEAHWHGLVLQWAIRGDGDLETWMTVRLSRLLDSLAL